MRTSAARNDQGGRETAGFSLIEVLAVIVILALVAHVATLNLTRRSNRATADVVTAQIASRARVARDTAVRSGRPADLEIDLQRRLVWTRSPAPPVSIPAAYDIDVTAGAAERRSASGIAVRFFPDGSSSGGTIRIGEAGRHHEVRVNWFTGRVTVVAP